MNRALELVHDGDRALEVRVAGAGPLFRYVFRPETPLREATRPYLHPLYSRAGELLTGFRPNDHPWHHGLNFTINHLDGWNFWGGPTYRAGAGYEWQENHGVQHHVDWVVLTPARLVEQLAWRTGRGETLLSENRVLAVALDGPQAWSLRWHTELRNVTERVLTLGNYHSHDGLVGSHYTGLQFRGARDLLDDHGDREIGLTAAGGLEGEAAVHGAAGEWMEWRGQKDATLRRVDIRFINAGRTVRWFVRRHNPLAALAFQYDRDLLLPPGAALAVEHRLVFTDRP